MKEFLTVDFSRGTPSQHKTSPNVVLIKADVEGPYPDEFFEQIINKWSAKNSWIFSCLTKSGLLSFISDAS